MASGITKVADIIVPRVFTPYVQQLTEEKTALVDSGLMVRSPVLDDLLSGGGKTFDVPSFRDLDPDADNVSSDDDSATSTPNKIETAQEVAVRLSRNNSWSTMDLTSALAGEDPADAIASLVANYWRRRLQRTMISTVQGIFADNDAAPSGTDTHTAGDLTVDVSGAGFAAGVTDLSAEAFIDAQTTMGDSSEDLVAVMMHSITYARARKNNLIDFVSDSMNEAAARIPTFFGLRVIVDDSLPNPAGEAATGNQTAAGIYHTWFLGAAALQWGVGTPKTPTEVDRNPEKGNGEGEEILYSRQQWALHPTGHAFIAGTIPNGGPANGTGANNLANAGSWSRVYTERKQIKIARLITREA